MTAIDLFANSICAIIITWAVSPNIKDLIGVFLPSRAPSPEQIAQLHEERTTISDDEDLPMASYPALDEPEWDKLVQIEQREEAPREEVLSFDEITRRFYEDDIAFIRNGYHLYPLDASPEEVRQALYEYTHYGAIHWHFHIQPSRYEEDIIRYILSEERIHDAQ